MSNLLNLRGQSILVTGATGFIGTWLCPILAGAGATVSGNSLGRSSVFPDGVSHQHRQDLRIPDACHQLVHESQPDIIVHLSSIVTGARDPALIQPMFQSNLCSSVHMMDAAIKNNVRRFVSAGSLEEPGAGDMPSSPYAAGKAATRIYTELYKSMTELDVAHVKIAMAYGPTIREHSKLVNYVALELLQRRTPRLTSGSRRADWIYVDDVAKGLAAIAAFNSLPEHELTLGTGKLSSVREVVQAMVDLSGMDVVARFGEIPDRKNETESFSNTALMQDTFGWSPRYTLTQGLTETLDWYRKRLIQT